MSRRVQPSCMRLVPPSSGAGCCGWEAAELTACGEGQGLEARGPGGRSTTPEPSPAVPLPRGRRAGSTRRLQPSAGAEPRPTRWSPVSHLPWLSGPRRAARGPCSPSAGHLPLEPHLSLSFLTCSRLSPVLSLTPKWPSTSSTVFVCAFSMAAGARPASPPVPEASSPPPRTRAAGSCHPGRPGADWPLPLLLLLLRPLPPLRALNHPAPPPPDNRPSRSPALAGARPGLSWAVGGSWPSLPSSEGRASFALNRPPGAQAAAPEPPPRSPEVIRGPARAGEGGARPTPKGRTERGRRAGGVVRGALALFPQLRTPDSGGGNCGEGEGGGVGDGSAAAALIAFIRRCLPSRRRRGMWTPLIGREGPARRGRHGPAPSPRPSLPRDSRPRRRAGPAPSRAPPPGTRIEAGARGAAPAQCAPWPAGRCRANLKLSLGSGGLLSPPAHGHRAKRGGGFAVGSLHSLPRG